MAKKYVPSGYQIINISGIWGDGDTYNLEDLNEICETVKNNLYKKPFLLKVSITDDESEQDIITVPTITSLQSFDSIVTLSFFYYGKEDNKYYLCNINVDFANFEIIFGVHQLTEGA